MKTKESNTESTVALMRKIRDEINEKTMNMTFEERIAFYKENAFHPVFKEMYDKEKVSGKEQ